MQQLTTQDVINLLHTLAEQMPAHKDKLAEMKALLKKHLATVPGTFGEFKG